MLGGCCWDKVVFFFVSFYQGHTVALYDVVVPVRSFMSSRIGQCHDPAAVSARSGPSCQESFSSSQENHKIINKHGLKSTHTYAQIK